LVLPGADRRRRDPRFRGIDLRLIQCETKIKNSICMNCYVINKVMHINLNDESRLISNI
jgi:hypothetical protein